jgi:hypothetical protein
VNKWIFWGLVIVVAWFVWSRFGGKIVSTVKGKL